MLSCSCRLLKGACVSCLACVNHMLTCTELVSSWLCFPQSDARELSSFTPSFLWLLRDFYLRLEDEQGRQVRWVPGRLSSLLVALAQNSGMFPTHCFPWLLMIINGV